MNYALDGPDVSISDAAVDAATSALLKAWGYEATADSGTSADVRIALEAAAPLLIAQALEDAVIDFGVKSVFLTSAQETMATWMRERAAELRL